MSWLIHRLLGLFFWQKSNIFFWGYDLVLDLKKQFDTLGNTLIRFRVRLSYL